MQKTFSSRKYVLFRFTPYEWQTFADFLLFKMLAFDIQNFIKLVFDFK